MKKGILIILGLVILVFAVVVWRVVANLDSIVAGIIEDVGTQTLKTEVRVSGVSIDLQAGKAGIAGLTIANPEGYSNAKLFAMEGIEVDLDLASISKDVLVIQAIRIANPKINFEGDASGGSNMQTLLDNMESAPAGETESGADATRMIIDQFEFTGGQVRATTALKPDEELDYSLPAIRMSGIGKSEGGVTADVVAKEIAEELVGAVIREAAKSGINKVIEKKTKGLLDKLKRD